MEFAISSAKNLISAPILFFFLGFVFSIIFKKNKIPKQISFICTVYLLITIGVKAGVNLGCCGGVSAIFFACATLLMLWGIFQTFLVYWSIKKWTQISLATAAACAACFGSISLTTFATACQYLELNNIYYQPFTIALMGLMEAPGIVAGLWLAQSKKNLFPTNYKNILLHSILNKSILLLLTGGIVGLLLLQLGRANAASVVQIPMVPILSLFLFDVGMKVGKNREKFRHFEIKLILLGIAIPILSSLMGILISRALKLDLGTGTLIAALCASSSYIAAPAAMRTTLPEADEGVYLTLSLGITFPFNVVLGIPLYTYLASLFL